MQEFEIEFKGVMDKTVGVEYVDAADLADAIAKASGFKAPEGALTVDIHPSDFE